MKSYITNTGEPLPLTHHQPQHIEALILDILKVDSDGMTASVLIPDAPSVATMRINIDWSEIIGFCEGEKSCE